MMAPKKRVIPDTSSEESVESSPQAKSPEESRQQTTSTETRPTKRAKKVTTPKINLELPKLDKATGTKITKLDDVPPNSGGKYTKMWLDALKNGIEVVKEVPPTHPDPPIAHILDWPVFEGRH